MSLFDTHDPKDIRAFYNLRDEIIERMRRNWKALETGLPVSEAELRFMSSCGLAENLVDEVLDWLEDDIGIRIPDEAADLRGQTKIIATLTAALSRDWKDWQDEGTDPRRTERGTEEEPDGEEGLSDAEASPQTGQDAGTEV